jgi:hypothetical protein
MEQPERLAERLRAEGEKTLAFFKELTAEGYGCEVYTEGAAWRIGDILAHFVSAEAAFAVLLGNVLEGGEGAPEGFDIDRFNEDEVRLREGTAAGALLESFAALREKTVGLVSELRTEDLQRTGRHPFLGKTTVEDMIKLIYRHNQIHLRDIRRALRAGEAE